MRLIGIDPGDRWIGLAGIIVRNKSMEMHSAVLDGSDRSIVDKVQDIMQSAPAEVFCEDFKVRPQAFNSFSAMLTPRLIGALEYECMLKEIPFSLVHPGPNTEFAAILPNWANTVVKHMKYEQWNHSMSAWRVLCRGLFKSDMMDRLRAYKMADASTAKVGGFLWNVGRGDFTMPHINWRKS